MKLVSYLFTVSSVYFGFHVVAQNNSNSSDTQCPRIVEDLTEGDVNFNATGTTNLSLLEHDNWHLSMTFHFRLARNTTTVKDVSSMGEHAVFLSVPESLPGTTSGKEIELCYYEMDPVNATSDSDSGESNDMGASCDGILSEECQEALRGAPRPRDGDCPNLDIEEACGRPIRLWTNKPFDLSQQDCTLNSLPQVDIPDGYQTQMIMWQGKSLPVAEEAFLDSYDLLVRQPFPVLITARLPGEHQNGAAEIACLATKDISEGSRVPQTSGSEGPTAFALSCRGSTVTVVLQGLFYREKHGIVG
ncbi:hypothetical protein FIE12Z_6932 [Fusarium flagelliforme]|uniref:Uncharacterized protein n=1 Tax=Fusarium flagelliforme TaxID=2675880 RepID=A0A395MM73_9HYPO|nr:hypothetical protein FIE12Z_6932 [Fusarium flagelliforme]